MADKKAAGFVLEKDQKAVIDELTNEEAGIVFKAIYEYEVNKKEPELDRALKLVFKQIQVKLDFYDGRYGDICQKNRENAQKRWEKVNNATVCDRMPPYATDANKIKEKKIKENKIKENSEREREIYKERDSSHVAIATPTSPTEIFSYCSSIFQGYREDDMKRSCTKMFNHYSSKNWKDIYNWQRKADEWIQDDINSGVIKESKRYF